MIGGYDKAITLEPDGVRQGSVGGTGLDVAIGVVYLDQGIEAGFAIRSVSLLIEDLIRSGVRAGRPVLMAHRRLGPPGKLVGDGGIPSTARTRW